MQIYVCIIERTNAKNMVDIHAHILPGLDDGAESVEEALRMASIAAESGIYHMAATSHGNYYPSTIEQYKDAFHRLQEAITAHKIPLKLYSGMEIFLDDDAFLHLERGELLTLNHTNYLLVEFDFGEMPSNMIRRIQKLQKMGYRVVVAHPERYIAVQKDPDLALFLYEQDCTLQVNGGSLLGMFGRRCRQASERLMGEGIAGVIATDAHDTEYRSPDIQELVNYLTQNYGFSVMKMLLSENPSRILKGYDILRQEYEEGKEE